MAVPDLDLVMIGSLAWVSVELDPEGTLLGVVGYV